MDSNNIQNFKDSVFEQFKNTNEYGEEYWSARDFYKILEYSEWRKFINVINKAKEACNISGQNDLDHFVRVAKMVGIGSGSQREIDITGNT